MKPEGPFRSTTSPPPPTGVRLGLARRIRHSKAGRIVGLWALAALLTAIVTGLARAIAAVAELENLTFVAVAGGFALCITSVGALIFTAETLTEGEKGS